MKHTAFSDAYNIAKPLTCMFLLTHKLSVSVLIHTGVSSLASPCD